MRALILALGIIWTQQWQSAAFTESPTENKLLGLFQGDIMIRNRTNILAKERNAITNRDGRWPGGVVFYSFEDEYGEEDRDLIRAAMAEFERNTCIRWVERTDEEAYVSIEDNMGCWSEVGRIGRVQSLSLQPSSCMKKGVIMHEMMHTLGFLHEQSRPDRDDYVRVIWENIEEGMEPNFEKLRPMDIDDLGLEYDYRSIVHYTAHAFAKDTSLATLEPTDPGVPLEDLGYGQKHGELTDLDLKKINKFYEC